VTSPETKNTEATEQERWRRIEELFHEALLMAAGEREAYLRRACADDASLLYEVRSLIETHEESGEFLDTPQLTTGLQLLAAREAQSLAGEAIGPLPATAQDRAGRHGRCLSGS
jgi:hypothetical protein